MRCFLDAVSFVEVVVPGSEPRWFTPSGGRPVTVYSRGHKVPSRLNSPMELEKPRQGRTPQTYLPSQESQSKQAKNLRIIVHTVQLSSSLFLPLFSLTVFFRVFGKLA